MTMTMQTVPGAVPCKQPTTALGRHCAPGAGVGFCQKATCMAKCSVTLMRCRAHGQGRAWPSLGADNTPDGPDALTCLFCLRPVFAPAASAALWSSCLGHRVPWPFALLPSGPSPPLLPCPPSLFAVGCSAGAQAQCQLGAGTLVLAHLDEKSRAHVRCCICCNKKMGAP